MARLMAYDADPDMDWEVLKPLGHDLKVFTNAGESLDYARQNQVDVALLGTPEGIDLISHLREINPQFKVILFCDSPRIEDIRQALRLAPCSYLFKPIVVGELEACLKRALLKGRTTIKGSLKI